MRTLGIDYGTKRFGLALSDPMGIVATGLPTWERKEAEQDLAHLRNTVEAKEVERVVVGLPRHMNGSLGPEAEEVLQFVEDLRREVTVPVITWDERLTSVQADRAMLEGNLTRKKRRQRVDRLAAQLLLQNYLDAQPKEK